MKKRSLLDKFLSAITNTVQKLFCTIVICFMACYFLFGMEVNVNVTYNHVKAKEKLSFIDKAIKNISKVAPVISKLAKGF